MSQTVDVLPRDEHNRELVANVHPPDWVNPQPAARYHLVVIGGGTAGLVSAAGAAILGARVALVERHLLGGDCLNVGCVPSKALIASARAAAIASRSGGGPVDFGAVMQRLRRLRAKISHHDSAARFRDLGVDVFLGAGRFRDERVIEVDGTALRYGKAVIATGGRPFVPPIEGLAEAGYLTNETVFELTERPARLLVLGAGPIGCELAQAFQRLGSRVTLVEMEARILPREDAEAAAIVAHALRGDGVELRVGAKAVRVAGRGDRKEVHLAAERRNEIVEADAILVAVGRTANVEDLGLDRVGVRHDAKGVHVDDRLRTTHRRIYAAGDVCLPYQFTHAADAAARIVLQNALFLGRKKRSALHVPWCTYTDPEIAHVGLYPREIAERGLEMDTVKIEMGEVDRAILEGDEAGFAKIHVRRGNDRILGATIVGAHAGELISEVSLAMTAGLRLGSIGGTIHPYPTRAEVLRKAADARARARLTPTVRRLLGAWLRLTG